ncbi:winged helix-turn-helix domain-containing protein [Methanolobus sp. ZRKC2]|uniref:winged helix-turn-helix domain-containing protein n=1 Tax=Methanolobus sp. ZRKC2 TaxID=3125783 RepID=UPI00324B4DC8
MGTDDFKMINALSNETRLKMFMHLNDKDMHISNVARELKISIPVASKHACVLEDANLIKRKVFGKTHVLSIKNKKICKTEEKKNVPLNSDYHKILETIESLKSITQSDPKKA